MITPKPRQNLGERARTPTVCSAAVALHWTNSAAAAAAAALHLAMAATLQFLSLLAASSSHPAPSCRSEKKSRSVHLPQQQRNRRLRVIRAVETDEPSVAAPPEEEPPSVDFAFVSPRLLPDGTPDVHYRTACGGQKLRDIMLQGHIDLYGPYDKFLLNCSGGGECGTCIVEVVEGGEMLSPKNEVEKEKLRRKPKTWRLACQATVGKPDSRGQMVIQQLPEWKVHEWDRQ
ncbi:photosynthetic NDH subunit of subcomplex B 3, chloroplastic [Brachypodium distachyon]|uniref:2Fe-2S ferredoxin-type domain-containing protein n=1 Tax=Brachypodium distachyon TaxID=15368 RepID=A0A0Q3KYE3_BRADI|nr:photosynthetic NDH subunit of subcomplex B 3, chloroplastic [Brachypodium distachyon]KQK16185.1 hypothetical protein BRADI_1g27280v3 [Brachypodium distachyon]|eukprot:XP_003563100.2 photosynthetic NDH subunit of subcomplex B 3, chloroplastic [Brachypodium distachyon]